MDLLCQNNEILSRELAAVSEAALVDMLLKRSLGVTHLHGRVGSPVLLAGGPWEPAVGWTLTLITETKAPLGTHTHTKFYCLSVDTLQLYFTNTANFFKGNNFYSPHFSLSLITGPSHVNHCRFWCSLFMTNYRSSAYLCNSISQIMLERTVYSSRNEYRLCVLYGLFTDE